jgi:hypothetical protein
VAVAVVGVAFALAFFVARAVAGGDEPPAPEPVQALPVQPVTVNNLERAPTMKPLRSIAGGPPAQETTP